MRRQGGGAVVQMSSVGGQVTAPGFGVYCATKFASTPMPEYAATVGPIRDYVTHGGGSQPGDPARAAAAIIAALDSPTPPLRLVLGADAIDNIRDRLKTLGAELDQWEGLGRDTAFEEG